VLNHDTNTRSFVKALSYRVLGSIATAGIVFVMTGKASLSVISGALDMVVKIGIYFVHERLWNHISFGRAKPPEYEI
jgi:uncharacterized membrane protein